MTLHATIRTLAGQTQILVTQDGDDILRAVLPLRPAHPRALATLLEGLALWTARPVDAVLLAGAHSATSPVDILFAGALMPPEHLHVRFAVRSRRRPRRLRGPGDFRALYARHGGHR